MKTKIVSKRAKASIAGADLIEAYAKGFAAADGAICKVLRAEIDRALPGAESRVWHGAPVWFVDGTPVVGYSVPSKGGVNLLFWNGQTFEDSALKPMGKFKAAQAHYDAVSEIDTKPLRRWLKKAKTEIWDTSEIRKKAAR